MRFASFLLASIATVALAPTAEAQLFPFAPSGCVDGNANGPDINSVGGQQPLVPNLTFAFEIPCPSPSNAAFLIWGTCNSTVVDWNLTDPCFGTWTNPPGTCRNGILQFFPPLMGALENAPGSSVVDIPFPIPDLRPIGVDLSALSRDLNGWCVQAICVDGAAASPCVGVSKMTGFFLTNT